MHGATPDELAPVVEAYRAIRPAGRFDALDPNPGRTGVAAVDGTVGPGRPPRRHRPTTPPT